jgi:hypothetical protein
MAKLSFWWRKTTVEWTNLRWKKIHCPWPALNPRTLCPMASINLYTTDDNREKHARFEFCMETDHCCFMTLSSGAAHSLKSLSKKTIIGTFSLKTHTVLLCTPSLSLLLLHDVATRSRTFSQDYWIGVTKLSKVCNIVREWCAIKTRRLFRKTL